MTCDLFRVNTDRSQKYIIPPTRGIYVVAEMDKNHTRVVKLTAKNHDRPIIRYPVDKYEHAKQARLSAG